VPAISGGVGGFPPRTTLSRRPLGHSSPPRDVGRRLRESPQKIRARGGKPPTPPEPRGYWNATSLHRAIQIAVCGARSEIVVTGNAEPPQPFRIKRSSSDQNRDRVRKSKIAQSSPRDRARDLSARRAGWGRGDLSGPVSSAEFLEAANPYLVAGSSGPAVCDSAWSGEVAPAPPGTQTASPSGIHTDREAAGGPTSSRDRRAASRRPGPARWTTHAPAAATPRAAAEAPASAPSPRAWRARPKERGSPRSGTPP